METLISSLTASLAGPEWLEAFRHAAAERVSITPFPNTSEEVWRYSRVSELDINEFTAVDGTTGDGVPEGLYSALGPLASCAGVVVVRNGEIVSTTVAQDLSDAGIRLGALADHPNGASLIGSVLTKPTDLFADLNNAFMTAPVVVDIPEGVNLTRPIVIVDWVDADGVVVFPRLVVRAGAGSSVNVVELHESTDVRSLACPVVEIDVGETARVGFFNVQRRSERFWQIASHVSRVARDASFITAQLAFGGDYARTRTDCRMVGTGGDANLLAGYFARRSQMLDFRTFQKHVASNSKSNLWFKGALDDSSRSVYTGMIKVEKGAKGCDADQTNENIKLGEDTWTESVPNLEIDNDDVKCTHASAVGPVDEEQRFYLESRGVPPSIAERLIVSGFYDHILDQVPVSELGLIARTEIDKRLGMSPEV